MIIEVVFGLSVHKTFDYLAPESTAPGARVWAPFGQGRRLGIAVARKDTSSLPLERLRRIEAADDAPLFFPEDLGFFGAIASYYQKPLGQVVFTALPAALRNGVSSDSFPESSFSPAGKPRLLPAHDALSKEQEKAIEAISSRMGGFSTTLLHGVTGSGKTEVYFHAAAQMLALGKQVLILVPEIALTPRLAQSMEERFEGTRLCVLHSGLSQKKRAQAWIAAREGQADILLGTRTAIFTPMPRLGLIIVDEEHDPSFKEEKGLYYSARDAAVLRAKRCSIPVILGSATPSVESLWNVRQKKYEAVFMKNRARGMALPSMRLIDMRLEPQEEGFSATLTKGIEERLGKGEQVVLFLNRRGFAPIVSCVQCGFVFGCPQCSTKLVFHQGRRALVCHLCGHAEPVPSSCPSCQSFELLPVGLGTQRIEEALIRLFPQAKVLRLDRDTVDRKRRVFSDLEKFDILVGTQMIAKGHDLARVTLAGVVDADSWLFSTDFRAEERLFSQLLQVAGRAGRGQRQGEAWIQTRSPGHPIFSALSDHNHEDFFEMLLRERQEAGFPPFRAQALLRARAKEEERLFAFLGRAQAHSRACPRLQVFDPVPAPVYKQKGEHWGHLLLQAEDKKALSLGLGILQEKLLSLPAREKVFWVLDVDPINLG